MEFKDLNCDYNLYKNFYAVALTLSFSDAANLLYISQPTVSYNVKKLETELGVKLFYRERKKISLTHEGKKILNYIQPAHNLLLNAEKSIKDSTGLLFGEVRIGAPTHIASFLIMPIVKYFNNKYPGIFISIISKSTKDLVRLLSLNIIDVVIDTLPIVYEGDKVIEVFGEEETCFACNYTYETSTLDDKNFILPSKETATRKSLDEILQANNVNLKSNIEISTTELVYDAVKNDLGIGFFFSKTVISEIEEKKFKRVDVVPKMPKFKVCCLSNKHNKSQAVKKFIKLIRDSYEKS